MKYIARERKEEVKRQSEAEIHRVVDMYGTDDFFRIGEMGQSGELTVWIMGRFGTTNFAITDRLLKVGNMAIRKMYVAMRINTLILRLPQTLSSAL